MHLKMRPRTVLHFLFLVIVIHPAYQSSRGNDKLALDRDQRSVVHFPDEKQQLPASGVTAAWRFQSDNNQLTNTQRQSKSQFTFSPGPNSGRIVPVPGTRGTQSDDPAGLKKGRKATPDVQDIISGIVHLLGGKVNLHAASGASDMSSAAVSPNPSSTTLLRPQMLAPHSTRINNRAPPRITEVPFEAIPLELGNSAGKPGANLPFGVPLRPPVFPPKVPQSGQNVQGLPFPAGIPLPIQLVPPVSPQHRPWPPAIATLATNSSATNQTTIVISVPDVNVAVNTTSSLVPSESTLASFFPEDSTVRHPPVSTTLSPTTPQSPMTTTTSSVAMTESSTLDSILQPSIEDVVSSSSVDDVPLDTLSTYSAVPDVSVSLPNLPVTSSSSTPPLPPGRPGQVFHDDYLSSSHGHYNGGEPDVITSDHIRPQYGDRDNFELVVTAAQNFGGGVQEQPTVAAGKPYVIPVDIDQIRGGVPLEATPTGSDEYVSIDGRKTYFNLFPTDTINRPDSSVQATAMPQPSPMSNNNGFGYAYPDTPVNPIRPPVAATRPTYQQKPSAPVVVNRPTASLIRRPSTTPLSRIDACIVGDPNACLEPNESCQAEDDGSACSCKPGFGRKKTNDVCKALTGLLVSFRLDRLDNQRLSWSPQLTNPNSPDYQQLQWEANKAINTLMEMTPLSDHFVTAEFNKFYAIGNKIIVNASVFMDSSAETQSVTVRPTLQKQLANIIQQRNNNLGISRLWVDGSSNPVTAILDLNECGSPELNDCSDDAECINTQGSFSCQCKAGFSDPYPNDPFQSGRQCNSCTRSHCNNRGECRIENGRKTCSCQGNYKGQTCELDGEVLGVAIGASVAAVIIIILTLVLLCMWSRRWRQNQEKMVDRSAYMEQLKTMPFPAMMQDRIRWAQYAEAMASAHNLYATPIHPPPYFYPTTLQPSPAAPSLAIPTLPPPPVPSRNNKVPVRQVASLPVALVSSTANNVINNLQELARKISRKRRPAPSTPDPVNVNPHLALISPAYPIGTMSSIGRASMAPTLPLVGLFHGARSTSGSVLSYGKRSAPPPPSNPPPALQVMETSEESAAESDAPIARPFQVPRPRSRSSVLSSNNIYFEADSPSISNDFSNQSHLSLNAYQPQRQRPYYR